MLYGFWLESPKSYYQQCFYRKEKEDCDTDFSHIYVQSVSMAGRVDTTAKMSQVSSRQQHRSNAEAQTPAKYFKRNVAIPTRPHREYQCKVFAFGGSCHFTTWPRFKCSLHERCWPQASYHLAE